MELTTLVTGAGGPVTVVAHGLGASLTETRPLVSGVPGTRVLLQARGHGTAPAPVHPGYGELAADLARVADEHGATQALGVSMGAATILHLLAHVPDRFEKVVLFLPAALDTPRKDDAVRRVGSLSAALAAADPPAVTAAVRAELPPGLGTAADAYVAARAAFLLASPGLPALLAALPEDVPVRDRSALASVTADVLVLAQEGDPLHPAQVARELAGVLPRARLVVFDAPGVLFRERARLRALIAGHLGA
ncbi:MAG: alpha/beta hydrolase [Frankiales bacterium]|nr:alpha/beta hydrolase [Frankiales bacterium]